MGLKNMLAQGVANEQEQLKKASKNTAITLKDSISSTQENQTTNANEDKPITLEKNDTNSSNIVKKQGGRPTNEEKGIKSRKQYTITLREDTYKLILDEARAEDISFAKFMERAAIEYINNHK